MMIIHFLLVWFLHPVHVSVTEIEYSEKNKSLQITSRIFIDDLELSIQKKLNQESLDLLEPKNGLTTNQLVSAYLNEHFKLTQGVAGLTATGYLQAAMLCGVIVGGAWADRWFRTNPNGRIYVPLIGLCCAAPGVLLAGNTNLLPVAILGLVVYGFARAFADSNMMPILCQVTDPRYRATGYGVLNFFGTMVGGFTIYAGGALRDAKIDVSLIFGFASASMLGCAALLFIIKSHAAANR